MIVPALPYDLRLFELPAAQEATARIGSIVMRSASGDHRMPCLAYSLELKRAGRFDVDKARSLHLPVAFWNALQHGKTVEHAGKTYRPEMVLGAASQRH